MARRCVVTFAEDLHAEKPIDDMASLQFGAVAVLRPESSADLMATQGWPSLTPRSPSRLIIDEVPLLVHVKGRRRPLETTGQLFVSLAPDRPAEMAVELRTRIAGDDDAERGWLCKKWPGLAICPKQP